MDRSLHPQGLRRRIDRYHPRKHKHHHFPVSNHLFNNLITHSVPNFHLQILNHTFSCHFSNHDKTMLIGADPSHHGDRCMCVTIHHCFFDGTRQRHPRVRFAKVHLYNNYTRNWGIYAVCASVESQVQTFN